MTLEITDIIKKNKMILFDTSLYFKSENEEINKNKIVIKKKYKLKLNIYILNY